MDLASHKILQLGYKQFPEVAHGNFHMIKFSLFGIGSPLIPKTLFCIIALGIDSIRGGLRNENQEMNN
jgi:hypothetical protein